ncbi:hypothetical protein D9M71_70260 [compost metagenome]
MTAAEDQRAGAVEGDEGGQFRLRPQARGQRQGGQQEEEQAEETPPRLASGADRQGIAGRHAGALQPAPADQPGGGHHQQLAQREGPEQQDQRRSRHQRQALPAPAQAARHRPDRLGDHRDGDQLQAVHQSIGQRLPRRRHAEGEADQQHGRRQGESRPRRQRAPVSPARHAQRHAHLAAGRAGEELAERDQFDVIALAQPSAPAHELVAEQREMGDRPAERNAAQAQEDEEDLPGTGGRVIVVEGHGDGESPGTQSSARRPILEHPHDRCATLQPGRLDGKGTLSSSAASSAAPARATAHR